MDDKTKQRIGSMVAGLFGVLIVILLFVWSIVGPVGQPKPKRTKALLQLLEAAIVAYGSEYGAVPVGTSSEIKSALAKRPHFDGEAHGCGSNCLDGWGNPVLIEVDRTGTQVTVRSYGKNGKEEAGSGDDIEITVPRVWKSNKSQNKAADGDAASP